MSGPEELERLGRELVGRFRELRTIVAAQRAAVDARDFAELSARMTEREKVQREVDSIRSRLDELVADRPELRRVRTAALAEAASLLDELTEVDEANARMLRAAMGEAEEQLKNVREMQRLAGAYRKGIGRLSGRGKVLDEVK